MYRLDLTKEEIKSLIFLVFGHIEANLNDEQSYRDRHMVRLVELLRVLISEYSGKSPR